LPTPGGAVIDRLAKLGNRNAHTFSIPIISDGAAAQLKPPSLMLSGGGATNSRLKEYLGEKAAQAGRGFYCPKPIFSRPWRLSTGAYERPLPESWPGYRAIEVLSGIDFVFRRSTAIPFNIMFSGLHMQVLLRCLVSSQRTT
jgi:hypothetical protein